MNTRSKTLLSVVLLAIYAVGYVAARQAAWIVHRAGYYTDVEGQVRVAGHEVAPGDFGVPLLASVASTMQSIVAAVYLPARRLEDLYWKFKVPQGSQWPSEWKLMRAPSNNALQPTSGRDAAFLG